MPKYTEMGLIDYCRFFFIKVSQKRTNSSSGGGIIVKQEQDDDQRSTSSREDETPFNSGGEPSSNVMAGSQNLEKGTPASIPDRRGRLFAKKARLSSTTSTTSTTSNAPLRDVVRIMNRILIFSLFQLNDFKQIYDGFHCLYIFSI